MNAEGQIRELQSGEVAGTGEIPLSRESARSLYECGTRARKDYYKAIRQGLSEDAALACALATERAVRAHAKVEESD